MFVVPVPAHKFLPFVIRAIESNGYVADRIQAWFAAKNVGS
jgi:hypothetical protein